ncbi:alpha/beta hydrolase [Pelagicoccus sp. SDUM812002]|uniref:alpha/beta hydrolase n=1 Tax=Pelagicoccus sp. SDUM812002 TaxID=3041266 RepID=UPI00280F41BE|nr:alpha/beta hydrolase [Pelagicoccus sp. SDUM812002]MDQ8186156.1 alpha/beta hydrolase [Pelagicoccus sp. SDUM812002]
MPENRANPESRLIGISYVRFPARGERPGPPIVYLAGGPGGSGVETARVWRFPLFMAMREFGDVIALDQRGTGWSNAITVCESDWRLPMDKAIELDEMVAGMRVMAADCADYWKAEGVDLAGYTTRESARDIEALCEAWGVDEVSLWGISYGSHLALATLKEMKGRIHKVVIAAVEGLEDTVRFPARTDGYFERLQAAIDADPAITEVVPDLKGLMRRVHSRLEREPVEWEVASLEGGSQLVVFGKFEMQMLASSMIADPRTSKHLPWLYVMADAGDFSQVAPLVLQYIKMALAAMRGMPEAMDVTSGSSEARLALVENQGAGALLGDLLNFPMPHLRGTFGLEVLGEGFWESVVTDVPTLAFSGTLDGRTYPESTREALAGFSDLNHVVVENGGHNNVYMQDAAIGDAIRAFMRGEAVPERIEVEGPRFGE